MKKPIKNPRFTKYNLEVWAVYINTAVYRKVKEILISRQIITRKKECQNCIHFLQAKSYVCLKKHEIREKSDRICEEYSQKNKEKTDQCHSCLHLSDRLSHFCFKNREPRNKTDKTCEEYKALQKFFIS